MVFWQPQHTASSCLGDHPLGFLGASHSYCMLCIANFDISPLLAAFSDTYFPNHGKLSFNCSGEHPKRHPLGTGSSPQQFALVSLAEVFPTSEQTSIFGSISCLAQESREASRVTIYLTQNKFSAWTRLRAPRHFPVHLAGFYSFSTP